MKFIGLTGGLEQSDIFNSVLTRPLNQGCEAAEILLQALMGSICLRRKKEMKFIEIKLLELTEYVHKIEFLPHEKEKYQALQYVIPIISANLTNHEIEPKHKG